MLDLATRSALAASLAARRVQRSIGLLVRAVGDVAPGEAPKPPMFVLSTEGPATDSHIVRQFWDLSRVEGAGAPILWNHNANILLGQWRDAKVEGTPGQAGARLVARPDFDMEDPEGAHRAGQVARGFVRACSVGWAPGALVRRGSLKEDDPLFRPMEDDDCGQPIEGYVMGTEDDPNVLIEASLTPTPADPDAIAIGRIASGERSVAALAQGERVSGIDLGGVLLALRDRPGVRSFVRSAARDELATDDGRALLRSLLAEELRTPESRALLRSLLVEPSRSLSLDSLFGAKPCAP